MHSVNSFPDKERSFSIKRGLSINRGYIDLHTHGLARYDTRTSRPDEILKIAALHGKKGVGAILPAIYPSSIEEMRANMEAVKRAMETQSRQKPVTGLSDNHARIMGLHLEGPFLNPARCGALQRDSFMKPTISNLKKLIDGYDEIIKIITIAPELPGALRVIELCRNSGIKVNMGHTNATYKEALEGKMAGATGITHIFNAMRPFHHRDPGIVCLALTDEDLYIEVIADTVHISIEALRLIFNTKRADRIIVVSDSVKGRRNNRKGALYKGEILKGSFMALSDMVENLRKMGLSEKIINQVLIKNPARYLNL